MLWEKGVFLAENVLETSSYIVLSEGAGIHAYNVIIGFRTVQNFASLAFHKKCEYNYYAGRHLQIESSEPCTCSISTRLKDKLMILSNMIRSKEKVCSLSLSVYSAMRISQSLTFGI